MTIDADRQPLPFMDRPSPKIFWAQTWTGRLIIINTLLFAAVCVMSKSLLLPDMSTLIFWGAKDPVGLTRGEWWRFVTPIFLHVGIVHFAVNSYMLYQIGYQIEVILGPYWFLLIYLSSGVIGNVASALSTASLSAGASGALFGLLGTGFYLERLIGRKIAQVTGKNPKQRVYAMTIALNLAIGFIVPFIDNAAHLGGLLTGIILTMAMMFIRPNRLQINRKRVGIGVCCMLTTVSLIAGAIASTKTYTMSLLLDSADETSDFHQKFLYLSQAYQIDPQNHRLSELIKKLLEQLDQDGFYDEAIELRQLFQQRYFSN